MPRPNTTFEITTRVMQGRFLLRPSKELNELFLGVIGRALATYSHISLHLFVVASNHFHLILTTNSIHELSLFMCYLNSNLSREIGKLHHWREKFWGRRYTSLAVLDAEEQIQRATYLLSHGCKEGLVLSPKDWPGVNCVETLTKGKKLTGTWYNRSYEYEASREGVIFSPRQFAKKYEVVLTPLPCLTDLSPGEQRARYRAIVGDIEKKTRKSFHRGGKRILGKQGVLSQPPHRRPSKIKKNPAPLCHCSSFGTWRDYRDNYRWFVEKYRVASRKLRAGELNISFPENCFPPPLAFNGSPSSPG